MTPKRWTMLSMHLRHAGSSEQAVEEKLGHRYQNVKEVEDDPSVPRATFFSRISRLEADYLPTPLLASMGALAFAGAVSMLPVVVAAGAGAALGTALSLIIHEHHARSVKEQRKHTPKAAA